MKIAAAAIPLVLIPLAGQADLVLVGARVIDAFSNETVAVQTVRIADGRIVALGGTVQANDTVIDLGGATLLPGVIDVHTHVRSIDSARRAPQRRKRASAPSPSTRWNTWEPRIGG